jgi:ATP-binding cassette, subfamily G (WHITE), member 2, SNQ2
MPDSSLSTISELEDLADAMIGFPGFGLSVEARKRLTIGVELASKPQLLLFLDEVSLDRLDLYKCTFFSRISFCTAYVGS